MNFSKNLDKENNPNLGLLGYLLSKMEYNEYSRHDDQTDSSLEFKLVNPPGNRPVVNQNPSQGDISLYKILISDWEYANRLYLQQQKAIDDLKSAIITSISISIRVFVVTQILKICPKICLKTSDNSFGRFSKNLKMCQTSIFLRNAY
jgi:hypothetical protein